MRPAGVAETVQVVAERRRRSRRRSSARTSSTTKSRRSRRRARCRASRSSRRASPRTRPMPARWSSTARSPSTTSSWSTASTSTTTCSRSPQNLFIEDAIEETQVLTSGISAEYGRFTGGVINAITKSGGNTFSGSGRMNFSNPSWTTETPFEVSKTGESARQAQQDLRRDLRRSDRQGSPLVLRGRPLRDNDTPTTLPQTRRSLHADRQEQARRDQADRHHRAEPHDPGRLSEQRHHDDEQLRAFEFRHRSAHRSSTGRSPNWYYFTNYNGVCRRTTCSSKAQYSQRTSSSGGGGTSTNIVDSPFFTLGTGRASTTRRTSTPPTRRTATTGSSPAA